MDASDQSYLVPMGFEEFGLLVEEVWNNAGDHMMDNQEVCALVSMAYHYCEESEY
jgi:hypothetical protein